MVCNKLCFIVAFEMTVLLLKLTEVLQGRWWLSGGAWWEWKSMERGLKCKQIINTVFCAHFTVLHTSMIPNRWPEAQWIFRRKLCRNPLVISAWSIIHSSSSRSQFSLFWCAAVCNNDNLVTVGENTFRETTLLFKNSVLLGCLKLPLTNDSVSFQKTEFTFKHPCSSFPATANTETVDTTLEHTTETIFFLLIIIQLAISPTPNWSIYWILHKISKRIFMANFVDVQSFLPVH